MELNVLSTEGDLVRMELRGNVVQTTLRSPEPMGQLLGDGGYAKRVILGMADTSFVDSSGIGWLLSCNKRFRQSAGTLVIHSVPPIVLDMMKIMRLDQVFKIADDERAAQCQATGGKP